MVEEKLEQATVHIQALTESAADRNGQFGCGGPGVGEGKCVGGVPLPRCATAPTPSSLCHPAPYVWPISPDRSQATSADAQQQLDLQARKITELATQVNEILRRSRLYML